MRAKLLTLTAVLLTVAAALLALRHERMRLNHQIAGRIVDVQRARSDLWRAEATAAGLLTPRRLQRRVAEARLALSPAPESWAGPDREPGLRVVLGPDGVAVER